MVVVDDVDDRSDEGDSFVVDDDDDGDYLSLSQLRSDVCVDTASTHLSP